MPTNEGHPKRFFVIKVRVFLFCQNKVSEKNKNSEVQTRRTHSIEFSFNVTQIFKPFWGVIPTSKQSRNRLGFVHQQKLKK